MDPSERFPETSWTLLARAREQTVEGVRAREDFADRYYRPVREFLLVLVGDPEQARELAQEFFARLSAPGSVIARAEKEKGAFHSYVQESLRNLAADYHRRRGKEALAAHPDEFTDGWEAFEVEGLPAAEAAFHQAWVKSTLGEALSKVRDLCLKRKQDVHLDLFQARYLNEADRAPSWEELGARYGMDQKAARERAETVARHFRQVLRRMLRNEIMAEVGRGCQRVTEAAIDEQIKALLSPLKD